MAPLRALRYESGALHALDQMLLPWRERWLTLRSADEVADALRRLRIRGAPLIGVAAAYGLAIELASDPDSLQRARATLLAARPTAVNLPHAVNRVADAAGAVAPVERAAIALQEALTIEREEVAASGAIAVHGADLLSALGVRRVLTHCNTGALAAPGRGTALAVLAELHDRAELDLVLCSESRPLLQGARLTTYELSALGIEHALIADGAAAGLIARGEVDGVIVGCDRVAANGDVANKVGTYAHALAASAHEIPFVVAGPCSTIDPATPSGSAIELELRDSTEVATVPADRTGYRFRVTPEHTRCLNPAFDVTPAELVTALVTDRGAVGPVDRDGIATLLASEPAAS